MKRNRYAFVLFLVFGLGATVIGNGVAENYFPATLGSYWVYKDQDGNELTRRAVKGKEIAGETYNRFSYESDAEDSANYMYHFHSSLYQTDEGGITFLAGDEIEKAIEARLTKEMEVFTEITKKAVNTNASPDVPNISFDINYNVVVEAQDHFLLIPTATNPYEKWDTARIAAKITMKYDIQGGPADFQGADEIPEILFDFHIVEIGNILSTETVETPAGTFENCLKVEYRTATIMKVSPPEQHSTSHPPGESVTTLWLAPNVGIVKFHQETENIFLKTVPDPELQSSTVVKVFELTKYEIKSTELESGKSN